MIPREMTAIHHFVDELEEISRQLRGSVKRIDEYDRNLPTYTYKDPCPWATTDYRRMRTPAVYDLVPDNAEFTRKSFPRLYIPGTTLRESLARHKITYADAREDTIALVIHGFGRLMKENYPDTAWEVIRTITSLQLQEVNELTFTMPTEVFEEFQLAPILLNGANWNLRNFLLWHQTFDVDEKIAFHALPLRTKLRLWSPGNLALEPDATGDLRDEDITERIRHHLSADSGLREVAVRLQTELGRDGDEEEMIQDTLKDLHTHYIPAQPIEQCEYPALALEMLPPPRGIKNETWIEWTKAVRAALTNRSMCNDGFFPTQPTPCVWCNCPLHAAKRCPFRETEGWRGPNSLNPPAWFALANEDFESEDEQSSDNTEEDTDPIGTYYSNL
ncbi:hypothetical protein C8F01DRAFT_1260220 [Mycena amicta]|nr:hypothetical protein C8F01DRAFT_1260220 [Mycena amicta]